MGFRGRGVFATAPAPGGRLGSGFEPDQVERPADLVVCSGELPVRGEREPVVVAELDERVACFANAFDFRLGVRDGRWVPTWRTLLLFAPLALLCPELPAGRASTRNIGWRAHRQLAEPLHGGLDRVLATERIHEVVLHGERPLDDAEVVTQERAVDVPDDLAVRGFVRDLEDGEPRFSAASSKPAGTRLNATPTPNPSALIPASPRLAIRPQGVVGCATSAQATYRSSRGDSGRPVGHDQHRTL